MLLLHIVYSALTKREYPSSMFTDTYLSLPRLLPKNSCKCEVEPSMNFPLQKQLFGHIYSLEFANAFSPSELPEINSRRKQEYRSYQQRWASPVARWVPWSRHTRLVGSSVAKEQLLKRPCYLLPSFCTGPQMMVTGESHMGAGNYWAVLGL